MRLSDTPGSGTPLSISSDGTVSVNKSKVSGLTLDGSKPVWATRVEAPRKLVGVNLPASREIWVVSDGVTVAGMDGSSVLWSTKLPEGAGALNSLGTEVVPRWQTSKGPSSWPSRTRCAPSTRSTGAPSGRSPRR